MPPLKEQTRAEIRRLYFVERQRLGAIAAELRLHPMTVRRALVLPGGARSQPTAGPYRKETNP